MLGHKTSLIKFRITEIRSNTFSDHDNLKIEINYKVKSGEKKMITWRLNNMLLNYQVVKNNRKLGNILRQMTMKTQP